MSASALMCLAGGTNRPRTWPRLERVETSRDDVSGFEDPRDLA